MSVRFDEDENYIIATFDNGSTYRYDKRKERLSKKVYSSPSFLIKKGYSSPTIDSSDFYEINNNRLSRRQNMAMARMSFSVIALLFVLVVLGRIFFSGGVVSSFNPETALQSVLQAFSDSSWNTEYLMYTLRNFSRIEGWRIDSSGILETLKTILSVVLGAGNLLLVFTALIINAGAVVVMIFNLLFLPL